MLGYVEIDRVSPSGASAAGEAATEAFEDENGHEYQSKRTNQRSIL
jgi:hypothetical protein